MRSFELNIFIDHPRQDVYEHLAEPINVIGLQPFMTTIDILRCKGMGKASSSGLFTWWKPVAGQGFRFGEVAYIWSYI